MPSAAASSNQTPNWTSGIGVEAVDVDAVGVVLVAERGEVAGAGRRLRHARSTTTVVALITAVALSPGLSPS